MANNLANKSFISTCLDMVLYNDQEAQNWREDANEVIAAVPVSWRKPEEAFGAAENQNHMEGNESTGKRKRCASEVEKEYEFSLFELYKTNNIDEVISRIQKDEAIIYPEELLQNLKGWTIEKRKRNKEDKFDKTYRHPKSKRMLTSLKKVKKFIEDKSCIRKASNNTKGVSPQDIGEATPKKQFESHSDNKLLVPSWSEYWETRRASHANYSREKELTSERLNEVPQSRQTRDLYNEQVFTGLLRSHEQEGVRSFGVAPSPLDDFGASSSSMNTTSLDEIKLLVESQVEAQLNTRVAKLVEERVSRYEKTHKEMVHKMNGMHRLLILQGVLPLSRFPNT